MEFMTLTRSRLNYSPTDAFSNSLGQPLPSVGFEAMTGLSDEPCDTMVETVLEFLL